MESLFIIALDLYVIIGAITEAFYLKSILDNLEDDEYLPFFVGLYAFAKYVLEWPYIRYKRAQKRRQIN